jgi:hypothetical protein
MKPANPTQLMLYQAIVVNWTKVSRGAPGATYRNQVPEVLPLPSSPPHEPWPIRHWAPHVHPPLEPADSRSPNLYLHLVAYSEARHFQDPAAQSWSGLTTRLPDPCTLRLPGWQVPPVDVVGTDTGLQVTFSWHEVPGAPQRQQLHWQERMVLMDGQWLQVRFNSRHSNDTWYYEKYVLNLGVVTPTVRACLAAAPPLIQRRTSPTCGNH